MIYRLVVTLPPDYQPDLNQRISPENDPTITQAIEDLRETFVWETPSGGQKDRDRWNLQLGRLPVRTRSEHRATAIVSHWLCHASHGPQWI